MSRYMTAKQGVGIRKGSWTSEEDALLINCIQKFGEGKWRHVPLRAGLNRCRKSCRLRWLNYLHPSIKRGEFAPDELDLIIKLHRLLGNRWSLIARRIPGRTAIDIKNYWNSHLSKKLADQVDENSGRSCSKVIKPEVHTFHTSSKWFSQTFQSSGGDLQQQPPLLEQQQPPEQGQQEQQVMESPSSLHPQGEFECWKKLVLEEEEERGTFPAVEWDDLFVDTDLWSLLETAGENQTLDG